MNKGENKFTAKTSCGKIGMFWTEQGHPVVYRIPFSSLQFVDMVKALSCKCLRQLQAYHR